MNIQVRAREDKPRAIRGHSMKQNLVDVKDVELYLNTVEGALSRELTRLT